MADTVRVRIAVCVDVDGYYCAAGMRGPRKPDEDDRVFAEDNHPGNASARHVVWVEADVPLPAREERTVSGEVVGE